MRRDLARRSAALLLGGLPVLAFPAPAIAPLAFVALVPLLLLIAHSDDARTAVVRGWWGATGYMLGAHWWLAPNVTVFLLPLAIALGALLLPWAWTVHRVLRARRPASRLVGAVTVVPATWVLAEYARSWPSLGGPWGLLGASQWNDPAVLGLAALGGVWLVSAVVVAVNGAVAVALLPDLRTGRLAATAVALTLVVGAGVVGARVVVAPGNDDVAVAGVQVGVVHDPEQRFDAGERATEGIAGPDLVVWGESSVAYDLRTDAEHRDRLTALAARIGAPLLVNTDAQGPNGEVRKASVVVTATGLGDDYVKTRLVPFGEYVPLRPLFGWVTSVTDAARTDRGRGRGAHLIDVAGLRVGPLVCFESSFPDLARTLVRDGAEVIVVQSATTTFQDSWAPAQHASLAAVRAVESGRSVLHATLSGVSAAFDSAGRRLVWEPTGRTGTYTVDLPLATGETLYVRTGDWVPALSGLVALIGLALVALRRD